MGILPPVVARLFADIRQFEGQMGKADGIMKGFGDTATATGARVNKAANYIIGAGIAIGVTSVKMAADFQSATTRLVTDAGESAKNLDMVRRGIINMAIAVGTTPKKLAEGMYYIESAGYHGAAALKILHASAEGAKVGFTDMATMGAAVTTVLRDYNLGADRAGAVTSALIKTVALGKTNMSLLGYAMGRVLPIASALGIPFGQVAGQISTMTVSGMQARFAVNEIRNSLLALFAPGNKAAKTMAEIHLSSSQLHTALMDPVNGVAKAMAIISQHLQQFYKKDSPQYVAAARAIYGGITGLSVAYATGGTHAAKYRDTVNQITAAYNSGKSTVIGWSDITKTLNFQMSQLAAAGSVFAINIGNWLLPKVTDIAKWGISVIGWFKSHPLISKIASDATIGLFVAAIVTKLGTGLLSVFNKAKSLFGFIGKQIGVATGATFQEQQIFYLREIAYNTATAKGKGLLATAEQDLKKAGGAGLLMKFLPDWVAKVLGRASLAGGLAYSGYKSVTGLWNSLQTGQFGGSLMSLLGQTSSQQGYTPSSSYVHDVTVKTKTGIRVYVTH
jgi:TP901 family phage tail tape measure protein